MDTTGIEPATIHRHSYYSGSKCEANIIQLDVSTDTDLQQDSCLPPRPRALSKTWKCVRF